MSVNVVNSPVTTVMHGFLKLVAFTTFSEISTSSVAEKQRFTIEQNSSYYCIFSFCLLFLSLGKKTQEIIY